MQDDSGRTCFTIMPFGAPFDRYYQNIFVPAIRSAGLLPRRADSIFTSTAIISDIWNCTKAATVVLADVTGKNPNVFYELGLAHAAGKPVVIVTNDLDDVPFDLKGLRVIEYDKQYEDWGKVLEQNIASALRATAADPLRAVPSTFLAAANPPTIDDPIVRQLHGIQDELSALRRHLPKREDPDEPQRLMNLLARHSNILEGVPERERIAVFHDLLQGKLGSAIERIRGSLNLSLDEATDIASNVAGWIEMYRR